MRGAARNRGRPTPQKKRAVHYQGYKQVVNIFKKHFPDYKVSVQRIKMSNGFEGYCSKVGNQFKIRINNKLTDDAAIYFFIHEFAHVLAWKDDKHGIEWGKAYSRCYRLLLKEWLSK